MWAALALLLCVAAPSPAETLEEILVVGAPARPFHLPALNPEIATSLVRGREVALHDLVGIRPPHPARGVVIFFFDRGTSSLGLPAMDTLARRYRSARIRFLGICLDDDPTAPDWIRGERLAFPILADPHRVVAGRYAVRTLPFIVLVDAEARIFAAGDPHALDLEGPVDLEITSLLELGPPIVGRRR